MQGPSIAIVKSFILWEDGQMLSDVQVREMSIEVDRQLLIVREMPIADQKDAMDEIRLLRSQLRVQKDAIVKATEEEADGFLRKFARVARRDVCEEGGLLNGQWEKYQDLSREDTLAVVAGALGLMGLANPVVVAIGVPITVIMLHLGLRTFCEEYGGE